MSKFINGRDIEVTELMVLINNFYIFLSIYVIFQLKLI